MALLIPALGEPREITPANGRAFGLEELQALVGGYIEAIGIVPGERVLFCNEDGKRLALPLNPEATRRLRHRLRPDDVIVGDVVICTLREAGEDDEA